MVSKLPAKRRVLKNVIHQKATELSRNISILSYEKQSKMSYFEFEKQANAKDIELGECTLHEYEDHCWKNLNESVEKYYAIDNAFSLFPDGNELAWNLNKFSSKQSIIHAPDNVFMDGIQSPYVYIGSAFTAFAFHLEDGDLYSTNYNHSVKPKIWYIVPGKCGSRLADLINGLTTHTGCSYYVRHKTVMIPPSVLQKNGIPFARVIQNAGEYMVVFSGSCHSGFNFGFNFAEANNFADESWLKTFEKYVICTCS